MANKTGKDVTFQMDKPNSTGTLVINDITSHCNSASISNALATIEDSALGDDERTHLPGLNGVTLSVSGFWNSTTEAALGIFIGNRTSVARTVEYGDGTKYYNGEAYFTSVEVSGSVDDLEVFSAECQVTGAMNRTSVKLT